MKLRDVIDVAHLEGLLKSLKAAFGVPCALVEPGNPVFPLKGRNKICADFHAPNNEDQETCRERFQRLQKKVESGESVTTHCTMGLYDMALPIMVDREYVGAIVVGQFLTRPMDELSIQSLSKGFGIPFNTLKNYFESLTVIPEKRLLDLGTFFRELADMVTRMSRDNARLVQTKAAQGEDGKSLECEMDERTRELERSERRLKDAQHIARMGSFDRDLVSGEGWWSDEFYRLIGLEPGEISCDHEEFLTFIHPEDRPAFERNLENGLKRGEPFSTQFRVITRQDELRWFYSEIFVDKDDFGKAVKYRGAFRDITARKRIEDELRSVNKLQQLILDNSIIGIALVRHRRFEWVNRQAAKMSGHTVNEMTGASTRIVYTDDEQYDYLGQTAYEILSSGESYDAVFQFSHKTLGATWCRFVATALNPANPDEGSIWMFEDITERRAADIALRKSRKELESIFSNSQVGIIFMRDGRYFTRGNQRAAEIFGYDTPEELEGQSMRIFHPSEESYREFGERYFNKLVNGQQTQIEYELKRKDGSTVWCLLSGKAVDEKPPIDLDKGVIWVIDDITVRKRAEAALRLSERRFRAIFTHAGVGICTLDKDGIIQRVNHRLCMLTGYDEYDLTGMSITEVIHPDGSGQDEELRSRLWMQDIPMYVREERYVRRDGQEIWGRVTTTVVKADDHTPQYLLQVIEDITERKRLESELVRLARTDSLTGLKNRHYFMERGNEEFERFKRYGTHMCALLMDIDHFKDINDTFGHHNGDLVLKKLAATCEDILRKTDVFGRIGGEEFAMVLVELDLDTAFSIAERIRTEIESTVVETEDGDIRFTVSIGATDIREEDDNLEKTLQRADSLMYEAKQTGRNRVVKG